jgi:hypothetical protein
MHFLPASMMALASLIAGALALPGAVVANSGILPSRDFRPLPDNSRFGCNPMEQDAIRREMVTNAMIVWCQDNNVPRRSIQSLRYFDTTFAVCNVRSPSPFPSHTNG